MSVQEKISDVQEAGKRRYFVASFLFCVIAGIISISLLTHCIDYLAYPFPLDDGEGFVTNQAKLLASGRSPYIPINSSPYVVTNYPPVYIMILAILVKVAGVKLTLGRLISVIAGLLMFLMVFLSTRKHERKGFSLASLIGPAILAATPVIYFWMPLCRVDMFANLLSLVAIYIFFRNPTKRGIHLALPLLLLALFTRQSAIEGFLVIGAVLFLNGRKNLIYFTSLYLGGAIVLFITCKLIFGTEFFLHVFTYTKTRWYLQRLFGSFNLIFESMLLPTILATYASWKLWRTENRIWVIYFIVGFLLALLSGKVGSAQNYFIPMFIPQAIIIGIWASDLLRSDDIRLVLKSALMAGMAVLIAYMGFATGDRHYSFQPNEIVTSNAEQLLQIINSFEGPVLVEDEGLTLLAGREVIYTPFIMNELSKEGLWDQSPFLDRLKVAEFDLIVLRFNVFDPNHEDTHELGDMAGWDRFSPEMEEAVRENYVTDGNSLPVRREWYFYTRRSEGPPKIQLMFE